ncbi:hypothetical protein GLOTRDRAFT_136288 [Gloeophyllum trabeum ATCC 11539]|uniref:Uncharacterized protein n=1 Tax=Gloeophyllum trabeum (strain ATCC 11539 / FP-39264 / Madison 617) TaxID=670483 RepID=S7QJ94_GLOTA|nr:uncharacterized protein GLOTRDRAFT_136288 [Gloeophyllum trabeum ATCC 11539]EPQ59408.1 hypothetical protein GLOTRDRAFT_136288 [Gloeophyllum trabeum ATCC 11539]
MSTAVATMSYHHTHSSLPTPPHSPPPVDPMCTAVHLLDSLQAFYHRERTWVLHTRAELEEKLIEGPGASTLADPASIESDSSAYSSAESSAGTNESTPPQPMHAALGGVKPEPVEAQLPSKDHHNKHTRWNRRKNGLKLKLEGISPKSRRRFVRSARDRGISEPGAQLLEMFGDLVDARMESCQRITRLIRSSNSSNLLTH